MFCLGGDIMKIIHTADWHLGKILNGHSFLEDQKYILEQFVNDIKCEKPDLVVVAGDIYDTSYPNKETVHLMEDTIATLNLELNLPVVMISGNHDGKRRLSYGSSWFTQNNLHIHTELNEFFNPLSFGDVDIYTLPFFTLAEARAFLDHPIKTYEQAISMLMDRIKPQIDTQKINLLIAHFTINGAPKSDSERDITIGTIEAVSPLELDIFHACLLGHIHHPFAFTSNHIFYSGSLLQYSFSEANQAKGYRIFEIDNGTIRQYFKTLTPKRKLQEVEGRFTDIMNGDFDRTSDDQYFHFKLKDMEHVVDPMTKIKQLYPNTLSLTPVNIQRSESINKSINVKKMEPIDIVERFYNEIQMTDLTENQRKQIHTIMNEMEEF